MKNLTFTLYFMKSLRYNIGNKENYRIYIIGGTMSKERRDEIKDYLFEAVLTLETIEDCYNFFDDLCTIKEIEEMAKRMCGAKMLDDDKVYTEITEKTGLSTATISRINRCLKYGSDGYSTAIKRLNEKGVRLPDSFVGDAEGEKKAKK